MAAGGGLLGWLLVWVELGFLLVETRQQSDGARRDPASLWLGCAFLEREIPLAASHLETTIAQGSSGA